MESRIQLCCCLQARITGIANYSALSVNGTEIYRLVRRGSPKLHADDLVIARGDVLFFTRMSPLRPMRFGEWIAYREIAIQLERGRNRSPT